MLSRKSIQQMFDDFLRDKNGNIVIAQFPNWPLWLAIILWFFASMSIPIISNLSRLLIFPTMIYWSYLEVFYGVNHFRKLLGILVGWYFVVQLLNIIF